MDAYKELYLEFRYISHLNQLQWKLQLYTVYSFMSIDLYLCLKDLIDFMSVTQCELLFYVFELLVYDTKSWRWVRKILYKMLKAVYFMLQCALRISKLCMCNDLSQIMFEVCMKSELWYFSFKVHNQLLITHYVWSLHEIWAMVFLIQSS